MSDEKDLEKNDVGGNIEPDLTVRGLNCHEQLIMVIHSDVGDFYVDPVLDHQIGGGSARA
jgi:hypothetical protein